MTLHLPILRHGEAYRSLDVAPVPSVRGTPDAEVSLATAAMLKRDVRRVAAAREALRAVGVRALVARTEAAARLFADAELPVGDTPVGPDAHVRLVSASTGLPEALVRENVAKLVHVLGSTGAILAGLSRGLDLGLLDTGIGVQGGLPLAFHPTADALAAVLPSNSPGVHSLWLAAPALLTPVVLKPGSGDPYTPLRLVQAMIAAGVPAEAFGFYPADHAAGAELVELHDRVLVFGGPEMARRYAGRPGVQVHGPGFAKVLVGPDVDARDHLDVIVTSIARNGGRSCINASTVAVCAGATAHADAVAEALAARLGPVPVRPLDAPDAALAGFADPAVAEAVDARIDALLAEHGGRDITAAFRDGPRRVTVDGITVLRPTIVRVGPEHPLARTEFGFPFAAVVDVPGEAVGWLGPTLVVTALTDDAALRRRLLDARHVDRLHLGPIPTSTLRWDQPHEGNLFEWLWRRRAVAAPGLGEGG